MSNQNQNGQKAEIEVRYEINGEQIRLTPKIVQDYIVGDSGTITLPEFKFFTELCKARKLNPFLKEAYCIKFGNQPAQIVVGKDAILKRAIIHPDYDGIESGIIVMNTASGEIIERKGTFYLRNTEQVVGGWAKVYRKNWKYPTYCSVSFDEVANRKKDGTLNSIWAGKGATMVEKAAKVRALRETFIEDLQGMYEAEEINVPASASINVPASASEVIIEQQPEPVESQAVDVTFDEL